MTTSNARSCFTCEHLHTWFHSGGREQPPESGWNCSHPDQEQVPFINPDMEDFEGSESELASAIATQCPAYQFFDWEAYHRQATLAAAEAWKTELAAAKQYSAYACSPEARQAVKAQIDSDYRDQIYFKLHKNKQLTVGLITHLLNVENVENVEADQVLVELEALQDSGLAERKRIGWIRL